MIIIKLFVCSLLVSVVVCWPTKEMLLKLSEYLNPTTPPNELESPPSLSDKAANTIGICEQFQMFIMDDAFESLTSDVTVIMRLS